MLIINNSKALKIILLFTTIAVSLASIFHPSGFSTVKLLTVSLFLISIILILIFFFKNMYKFSDVPIYFRLIFLMLIFWSLFTILRSINTDTKGLLTLFGNYQVGALSWLTPFAIVFGFNIASWFTIFKLIPKIFLIGIFLGIGSFSMDIVDGVQVWLILFPIMLLTYFYHTKYVQYIVIASIIMYLINSFQISQRANFIYISMLLVFFIVEFIRNNDISIYKKITLFFLLLLSIIFGSQSVDYYAKKAKQNKEISTDTRTFLFKEINKDMSFNEKLIGRGALGTYYSPYFAILKRARYKGGDSSTRPSVEVGYLFMLLKGGFVMIVLYLLLLLPAAYIGIVKSNNIIARMSGYYILSYIIMWTVTYSTEFQPQFIILWIAAGTIIYRPTRELHNEEILIVEEGRQIFAKY